MLVVLLVVLPMVVVINLRQAVASLAMPAIILPRQLAVVGVIKQVVVCADLVKAERVVVNRDEYTIVD